MSVAHLAAGLGADRGDLEWMRAGACQGLPVDVFFPQSLEKGVVSPATESVREICRACPSHEPCLAYALSFPTRLDQYGILAGTTPDERARMRAVGF